MWNRRGVLAAGAAAGVVALTGAARPKRSATVAAGPLESGPLEIVTGEDRFESPATAPAGAVTFRVRTTGPLTGTIGIAKLLDGATEAQFRARMRQVFAAEDPADVIRASRELMATADQLGGAAPHPGADSTFTLRLRPGAYLVLEYLDFAGGLGRQPAPGQEYVRPLIVGTHDSGDRPPRPCGTLTAFDGPAGAPRFALSGRILADQPLRYVNAMRDHVNEARLYPVVDDAVTEADVVAFFKTGTGVPPIDFAGGLGTPPLSSGREVTLRMPMRPGRYAVVSWVRSLIDAQPLTAQGQLLIVRVP
ncbi:hypothetical protein [Streptomyces sp. NPDC020681]|uniref:hypothetical protein n=1 Tax=Streptomyces sp. NPDC020681 TaxID=3365083 RepID=UPI00379C5CE9